MYAGLPGRTQLENFVDIKKNSTFAVTVLATLPVEQRTRAGLLLYLTMLKYTKTPMDLPDQIAVLKSRGLIVEDDTFALH